MALFLLCPNLGWIQGQFNFTELSLRYQKRPAVYGLQFLYPENEPPCFGLRISVAHTFGGCPEIPLPGGTPPPRPFPAWRYPMESRFTFPAQDIILVADT
jgi:hypothetical protein